MTFIGQFGFKSGRDINKFENVNFLKGITGAPMVTDWSLAVLEAKVLRTLELDTHVLFVGNVVASKFLKELTPLTYADYHQIKKGKSPKTAPTFGFNSIK
ncbi:High molecular weight rubredoxin [bioreactor metagenome]|uniref:High molecular weight rubredoxin n=1 Tax=bioreactor metagenome TaxID=1076179 RepID=A0A645EBQ1_9ZZZZ